ncbi:MAG: aminotransferase class IV [Acidobacteriota bacterium]|nr:aminotransferase class IV [Acidobacteriota bacterium]
MHRLLLHNDEIVDTRQPRLLPGQVGLMNGWGVFSTFRVADGALFAFPRHWARMQKDARKMHVPFPESPDWMQSRLLQLIKANRAHNATLRVAVVRNRGGLFEAPDQSRDFDLIAFTADIAEWPQGVRLGIKPQARHAQCEFAGVKFLSWSQNLTWYEEAHQRGFDEYVLLNERDEIAECTSANIFAVFGLSGGGFEVATPPLSAGCLAGITRAILLEEIRVPGITIGEKTLRLADLERAEQVFITSSTRDLLSVVHLDGLMLKTGGKAVDALQRAFVEFRQADLAGAADRPVAVGSF